MFVVVRHHARTPTLQSLRRASSTAGLLETRSEVAKKLVATGLWKQRRRVKGTGKPPLDNIASVDKTRINLVDESLCDGILQYLGPSLQRHAGYDLIDIFPGAAVWSSRLHQLLRPRRHLLLEPDHAFYKPFLKPLLEQEGVRLLAKSGISWPSLSEALSPEYLPEQQAHSTAPSETPKRNDTLLVTANLAAFPKRRYADFDSVAKLVLHQFVAAIQSQSLFQRYGLVRMLVWLSDDEKGRLLPRCAQNRRRFAVEGELACESIVEVCGADSSAAGREGEVGVARDAQLDWQSAYDALERMRENGLSVPAGRETSVIRDLGEMSPTEHLESAAARWPAVLSFIKTAVGNANAADALLNGRYRHSELLELDRLERASRRWDKSSAARSQESADMKKLQYRLTAQARIALEVGKLREERDVLAAMREDGTGESTESIEEAEREWTERVEKVADAKRLEFGMSRDNRQVFGPPTSAGHPRDPVLFWDRRPFEPLAVSTEATEFLPNMPCALLDLQPKAMNPQLLWKSKAALQDGPCAGQSAAHYFDLLLQALMRRPAEPLRRALDGVWPGAGELVDRCPALLRTEEGGSPVSGFGELTSRTLSEAQWMQLLDRWMAWEFRPEWRELVRRVGGDSEPDDGAEGETMGGGMEI